MTQDLQMTFRRLWEAACMDKPQRPSVTVTEQGAFQLRITGRANWHLTEVAGVPEYAIRSEDGDTLTCRWPSHADVIFGYNGLIAQRLANYKVRLPQLHMARLVQRAIETGQPAVVEAGTGVGKSYAYAAICMAMNKRVVISTSNKALQMQLYRKDIPFLCTLFPGKSVALAVGKSNYACRLKCDNGIADAALNAWYSRTESGNVEEIDFAVSWAELAAITVDDDCGGRHCGQYHECFYYDAKAQRQVADVVITNHALLCLHELHGGAGILPSTDVLVIDEAHKLPDYARAALGVELRLGSMGRIIDSAQALVDDLSTYHECTALAIQLERDVAAIVAETVDAKTGKAPSQVALNERRLLAGVSLADSLVQLADEIWADGDLPTMHEERKRARRAGRIRALANKVLASCMPGVLVRWIEAGDGAMSLKAMPADVSEFIGRIAGVTAVSTPQRADHTQCARCRRTLTADRVAVLDGRPYGPDCIRHVDLLGDAETMALSEWLGQTQADDAPQHWSLSRAVVLCSATLAAPDLSAFLRECGIPDALQMVAASPFPYADNALIYLPNGASPAPTDPAWREWVVEEMDRLVVASGGGAFLLFTSVAMMQFAAQRLRGVWSNRFETMMQGELPKLELAERFRRSGNAVLFATKSFFEGVSIDGAALRLVVVDKMPFDAPSPLSQAMEAHATEYARRNLGYTGKALEMYPFDALRVPRMIIELKQAAGRLIRTATDTGVIAVLDSRIRSAQYGRSRVIPALPPAPVLSSADTVVDFLRKQRPGHRVTQVTEADKRAHAVLASAGRRTTAEALPLTKKVNYEQNGDVLWA